MRRILAAAFLAIAATPLPAQERMTIEVSIEVGKDFGLRLVVPGVE